VAFHDEAGAETHNWLHVTRSAPERRAQYEMRWVEADRAFEGIARFGADSEGPPGCGHGGAIATFADAATATAAYKAMGRWGMTTKLECNYRAVVPLCTPVRLRAVVADQRPRKCTVDWELLSLVDLDRDGNPVRHAFGTASFLHARA